MCDQNTRFQIRFESPRNHLSENRRIPTNNSLTLRSLTTCTTIMDATPRKNQPLHPPPGHRSDAQSPLHFPATFDRPLPLSGAFLRWLLVFLGVWLGGEVWGQSLAEWSLTAHGNATMTTANVTAGTFTKSGVNDITFGNNGVYAHSWPTGEFSSNHYYEITATPDAGYSMNITSLAFSEKRSNTGIGEYQVRYSLDNFASYTTIATVSVPDNDYTRNGTISGLNIVVSSGKTIAFRFFGYEAEATGGTWRITDNTLKIIGTVAIESTDPTLTATPSSLSGLGYEEFSSTSPPQSFSLSGFNLEPEDGDITVAAPEYFEISLDEGGLFTDELTLSYTGGALSAPSVYVRLKENLEIYSYTGHVTLSGGGADDKNVFVEGEVWEFLNICGEEDFENIPSSNSSSYSSRSWTG